MVVPCKGSNKAMDSAYRHAVLGKDSAHPGMHLFHVDTILTQAWIDKILNKLEQGDPGCMYLHSGELDQHQDFLEQLLNDTAKTVLDTSKNEKEIWERINESVPNDFRDCRRYSYAAMLIATRGAPIRPRAKGETAAKSAVISAGKTRPDGRQWFTQR
jgi:phage terminase large subunit GpA-like protein